MRHSVSSFAAFLFLVVAAHFCVSYAKAETTFTNQFDFLAALTGEVTTYDFDEFAHETILTNQLSGVDFESNGMVYDEQNNPAGGGFHTGPNVLFNVNWPGPTTFVFDSAVDGVGFFNASVVDREQLTLFDTEGNVIFTGELPQGLVNFLGVISKTKIASGSVVGIPPTNGTIYIDTFSFGTVLTVVTKIFPESLPSEGGVLLGIWGGNFSPEMTVSIGGKPAEILAFSESYVSVLVPDGTGTVDVVVTTPSGEEVQLKGGLTYKGEIPRWDVNEDGIVNIIDLVTVGVHFGESTIPAAMAAMGLSVSNREQMLDLLVELEGLENPPDGTQIVIDFLRSLLNPNPIITKTKVFANYPNPFNPETWIPYQLEAETDVEISIYSVNGHLLRTLQLGTQPSGEYIMRDKAAYWDGRSDSGEKVSSGTYFYHFQADDYSATRKMIILK